MSHYEFRQMQPNEQCDVANLIRESTNSWYDANGKAPIFTGDPNATMLFCDVYEALDPGCCLVAVEKETGQIAASCFYHPRSTHVSLGIMNVHPNHFGKGLARQLLDRIVQFSEEQKKPTRLVSSAINLDSFSLYNRGGFVPRQIFQDMTMAIPKEGLGERNIPGLHRVRDAHLKDLNNIVQLEKELCFIDREKDHRFFLENAMNIWNVCVIESEDTKQIDGVLVSVKHPGSTMLGPGFMRSEEDALALIRYQLDQYHRGGQPVWLVPSSCHALVEELYGWGAKNCELHFAQTRGEWQDPCGVTMPTFMPETS